jgi:hypothetical protein
MVKVVSVLQTNVDSGSPSALLSLDISAAFGTLHAYFSELKPVWSKKAKCNFG